MATGSTAPTAGTWSTTCGSWNSWRGRDEHGDGEPLRARPEGARVPNSHVPEPGVGVGGPRVARCDLGPHGRPFWGGTHLAVVALQPAVLGRSGAGQRRARGDAETRQGTLVGHRDPAGRGGGAVHGAGGGALRPGSLRPRVDLCVAARAPARRGVVAHHEVVLRAQYGGLRAAGVAHVALRARRRGAGHAGAGRGTAPNRRRRREDSDQ